MTAFRASQALAVLRGLVVTLAPHMQSPDALREAVRELLEDRSLWAQLELERQPLPRMTRRATMLGGTTT